MLEKNFTIVRYDQRGSGKILESDRLPTLRKVNEIIFEYSLGQAKTAGNIKDVERLEQLRGFDVLKASRKRICLI
ncbi:hypothetical protein PGLA_11840 [Paenibacillus glacialis]|uniref:Uncharacterized protein n=1 Tax=Paenibacillus glacialis TaxID=494026 RepID=A0A168KRB5_9BACL|nr:hypothetical protein PGLA_11840 [Paenibacillus glacialis]